MKKVLLFLSLIGIMTSCSGPLDKKYNEDTLKEDAKAIKEAGDLSDEDAEIMAGWIVRAKLKDENLEGRTFDEILVEAKDYKKEQEKLVEKVKREEEDKRQRLASTLTVVLYDKGYEKYDYEDYLTYSLAFENKTDKDIRAFKGSISLHDLFDTEIKTINLTIDDPISAGETFRGTYTTDYNQFIDEDKRLKNKGMEDLKIVWNPEKIIFMDGTTLE
ncbi:hypothetical protein QSE00_23640 [Arenibacter sp. M-2]|uniref:hypothetical protein n=1 Tax=Arenibacter sp. M-2 TaxID=3053612 RepID=UPI00256FB81C|nr:hypothetical protein [Arenibacter sp. M-2]MDL5514823.1 hypothetical protein [Arenibacter sp. M-2]